MNTSRMLSFALLLAAVALLGGLLSDGDSDPALANEAPLKIAAGSFHTCALTTDSEVKCWGNNFSGQLGNGSTEDSSSPESVCATESCATNLTGVSALSAGSFHTCALIQDGGIKCWGRNIEGQIGEGLFCNPCTTPQDVCGDDACLSDLSGAVELTAGSSYTCARMSDRTVKCWGGNPFGQLGNGSQEGAATPVDVCADEACSALLSDIVAIDAGRTHVCALQRRPVTVGPEPPVVAGIIDPTLTFDAVVCWGSNIRHELGADTGFCPSGAMDPCSPVPVDVCADASCETALAADAVTAGLLYTCALMGDSTAKCWGYNFYGQLGTSSPSDAGYPETVCANEACQLDLSGVTVLEAAEATTCAITSQTDNDGLKCWGRNNLGQVGIGEKTEEIDAPRAACRPEGCPGPLIDIETIALGVGHACAIAPGPSPVIAGQPDAAGIVKQADALMCWGANARGQLGDGTMTQRTLPVAVSGIKPTPTATPGATESGTPTTTPDSVDTPSPTDTPAAPEMLGDVDCNDEINAIDAAVLLQFLAGLLDELPCPDAADVNGDGQTNAVDAALILQYIAGLIDSLPPS